MTGLTAQEKRYVDELRDRVKELLHPNYDTDFNLYRWIVDAERVSRIQGNPVDTAAKNLRNHLRFRKALKLDEKHVTIDENAMFVERYQSKPTLHYLPSCNKYLCWLEYASFDTAGLLQKQSTSENLLLHFYFFDHLLRVANARELETKRRVSFHVIMDTQDYEMNPWTIVFASNGQLAQLIQLFIYEHYPQLVHPYSVINTPKWILWPIKLIKAAMPGDFCERIHFYDDRYKDGLLKDMTAFELPKQLGGKNPSSDAIQPVPGKRIPPSEYYNHKTSKDPVKSQLAHIQAHVGQRKFVPIHRASNRKSTLSWFFITDGDIKFGIFYTPQPSGPNPKKCAPGRKCQLDELEMVYPYIRLGAKLVPERGSIECEEQGTYYLVFCNQHSWFYKRNIYLKLEIDGVALEKQVISTSACSV